MAGEAPKRVCRSPCIRALAWSCVTILVASVSGVDLEGLQSQDSDPFIRNLGPDTSAELTTTLDIQEI